MRILRIAGMFCVVFIVHLGLCAEPLSAECNYEKFKAQHPYEINFLMQQAVESNCPDLMDSVLKNEKPNSIYSAISKYWDKIEDFLSLQIQSLKATAEDDPGATEVIKAFKGRLIIVKKVTDFLKAKCPDESKNSTDPAACIAWQSNKEFLNKFSGQMDRALAEEQAAEKEADRANMPEVMIDQVCACDKFIALNKADINREKEVGKISGTVNMMVLNNAGNHIVDIKKIRKDIVAKYKFVTKKELKKYKCTNLETLTNPLLWQQGAAVRDE